MKKHLLALALIAATGAANAAVFSQAQEYAYPAGTSTNWGNVPGGAPNLVELAFNGFDSNLGTLDSVIVTLFGAVTSSVTVNAISAEPFGADVTGGARIRVLAGPGAGAQLNITSSATTNPLAAGSHETIDFGTKLGSTLVAVNAADFLSNVTFSLAAIGGNSCGTSGGNNGCDFSTTAGARIEVDYNYTPTPPAPVPEPASMALIGLGALGLAAVRRRK